jgi:ABC-type uncharacterized transport system YnjBCD ATPase subunit
MSQKILQSVLHKVAHALICRNSTKAQSLQRGRPQCLVIANTSSHDGRRRMHPFCLPGSGKSTLLNTLALRLDPAVAVAGKLTLNGRAYDRAYLKRMR